LQRRLLRTGYNYAARKIEMGQENSIVGPAGGATPREVLVRKKMGGAIRRLAE
jgi:DNA segregation ATPase FtsK/SpoIIIE, S-DNA-T family